MLSIPGLGHNAVGRRKRSKHPGSVWLWLKESKYTFVVERDNFSRSG